MRHVPREMAGIVSRAARSFPAVVLSGPRRSGKTWLLRHLLPGASYFLLEDPDVVSRFRADPRGFLDAARPPVILDEVQNVPEALAFVRSRIDAEPRRPGRWFLTGSREAPLMEGVTESMAGRAAVLHLLPFSFRESRRVSLLRGGYPEVLARPSSASLWFSSYVQTYLERDVRAIVNVRDLATFRRFLALLAVRHGQVLNRTDLASPLGVSVPTISQWLGVLEVTAQIILVPAYFENMGKRIVKSPKVYIADSGLACHLLGLSTHADLERSPFLGALLEGFVAAEILKAQANAGRRRGIYHFRDQQGLEVDFMVPGSGSSVTLIEVKASRTPRPEMAGPMVRLSRALTRRPRPRMMVVHRRSAGGPASHALAPGVEAWPLDDLALDPPV